MNLFPKISIITPSYNQGQFIEETILSVINQSYPNIEYIIIDGGSSVNTIATIKKYEEKLAYWISEPDKGQPDAINKGLAQATGEIIAFLNSDDYYEPGTFEFIAAQYNKGYQWIIGSVRNFRMGTETSYIVKQEVNTNLYDWLVRNNKNHQPGNFWSRKIFKDAGYMDENLHYSFDWEYWLRFIVKGYNPVAFNEKVVANFRLHEESKTVKFWAKFNGEYVNLMHKYKKHLPAAKIKVVNREIKKLQVNEKISFGRIESINGSFKGSLRYFKEAFRISPHIIFTPQFLFEFCKAFIYMPVRKIFSLFM